MRFVHLESGLVKPMNLLTELNAMSILLRVSLALLIGGVIGLERGNKNQPAGFRTYMLVCLGASLVMMTNQYVAAVFGTGDPTRMGAQVISGIGFLGAGTIIVTKRNQVRGLTTAAGLWSAACLGLAIGIGFYEGAVLACIAIMLIMTILQKVEYFFRERSAFLRLYVNFISIEAMNQFVEVSNANGIKVLDMQISKINKGREKEIVAIMQIKTAMSLSHSDVIQTLCVIEGLKFIEEI